MLVFENAYTYAGTQFISKNKMRRIIFPPPLPFQLKETDLCHMEGWELRKEEALCLQLYPVGTCSFPWYLPKSKD